MRTVLFFLFVIIGQQLYAQSFTINRINYTGLKKTLPSFVTKISIIKPNTLVDSTIIENDLRNFRRLPSIAYVKYTIEKDSINNTVLTYNFVENITLIPTAQVSTAVNQTSFRVGLAQFNFLKTNKQIGGFYQYNGFHSVSLAFRDAFLFSRKSGIETRLQSITTIEPVYFNNTSANYKYTISSLDGIFVHQPNVNHRLQLGYTIFQEKYSYQSGTPITLFPQVYKILKHQFRANYEYNKLNFSYQYIWGIKNSTTILGVVPGTFLLASNDINMYKRIGAKGNWASRFRLGKSTNTDNTPLAAFAVDNNLNIRGVGNIVDRGVANVVLNTEYRHTVIEKKWFVLQSNTFVDAGTWQKPTEKLSGITNSDNVRVFTGVGLRFIHKRIFNAVIRFDYGFNTKDFSKRGLVFGIGQYF